jgi:GPH family glycoside/pentoside/hexuronide:cation symporter
MATDIILAGMPFMVTRLMGLDEEYAGYLQGVLILGAMLFFPLVAAKAVKHGKKSVYLFGLVLFAVALALLALLKHFPILGWPVAFVAGLLGSPLDPNEIAFAHTVVTLAICALPLAVIFVMQRPILNDVMDHDETLTGYRREAMYNGMEGLVSKPASGLAYFIVPLLLSAFGDTAERPWGVLATPIAASVLMFLGYLGFRRYPLDK